jgi:hypothetical protein
MATIQVDIVSAEGEIHSGTASMVFAPAKMGEVGIAPRHAPMLTPLSPGEVRVRFWPTPHCAAINSTRRPRYPRSKKRKKRLRVRRNRLMLLVLKRSLLKRAPVIVRRKS